MMALAQSAEHLASQAEDCCIHLLGQEAAVDGDLWGHVFAMGVAPRLNAFALSGVGRALLFVGPLLLPPGGGVRACFC
jgi:hypothetical protein